MIFRLIVLGISFFVLSSCSHFVRTNELGSENKVSHTEVASSTVYRNIADHYKSPYGEISLDSHPDVDKWINYFTDRGHEQMQIYLERSSRYLPLMKSILRESDLPMDLVYVALIESGFSPRALSQSNAVGYWQFIYGTGKRYGLRIDGYVDERKDPILSTRAAANYFKDLYSLFGSWPLALASYNSGEYRVNRAVLRHYNRDFWFLSSKKALPRETRNYIPKLIAAIRISKNPKKYGFFNLNYQEPINYELIKVKKSISLVKLAKQINIPEQELKALNPMYKGEYVPVYEEKTVLRIPVGLMSLAQASLEESQMNTPKYGYYYHSLYRVRRGDSLYRIARRHRTTVSKIRRENKLGKSSFLRIGQKLKIPTTRLVASKKNSSKRTVAGFNKEFHTVRRGQTLSFIARLYGLDLTQFKGLNNIQGNPLIHPGQKFRVKKQVLSPQKTTNKSYHIVQKGDTLIGIAKKYNASLPKLMKTNSMSFKSVLLTGTRLIIPK